MGCNIFDEKPVRTGSDTPWKENNMKIAIVTDSNSGITQSQAGELGIFVLPMPFMINGETFEEDINLTQEEFLQTPGGGRGYQHLPAVSAG